LTLDITGFTEALSKCSQKWLGASESDAKKAHRWHRRLLRMRCEWPYRCGADSGDEFSSLHCLTQLRDKAS
jgi:hypothetical protein